jgi:hypothetical protein
MYNAINHAWTSRVFVPSIHSFRDNNTEMPSSIDKQNAEVSEVEVATNKENY